MCLAAALPVRAERPSAGARRAMYDAPRPQLGRCVQGPQAVATPRRGRIEATRQGASCTNRCWRGEELDSCRSRRNARKSCAGAHLAVSELIERAGTFSELKCGPAIACKVGGRLQFAADPYSIPPSRPAHPAGQGAEPWAKARPGWGAQLAPHLQHDWLSVSGRHGRGADVAVHAARAAALASKQRRQRWRPAETSPERSPATTLSYIGIGANTTPQLMGGHSTTAKHAKQFHAAAEEQGVPGLQDGSRCGTAKVDALYARTTPLQGGGPRPADLYRWQRDEDRSRRPG